MKILSRDVSSFAACSEVWMVQPDILEQTFRLLISAPQFPAPQWRPGAGTIRCGLIALDGDLHAGATCSAVSAMTLAGEIPPTVVVSIAYPLGSWQDYLLLRSRDLTPSRVPEFEDFMTLLWGRTSPQSGGADAFLRFLEQEVMPAISSSHGVDEREWTLTGHSLGGLFTLHALLSRPGSFRRYNAVSPSACWNRPLMFERARQHVVSSEPTAAALHLSVGDRETRAEGERQLADASQEFRAKFLAAWGGMMDMVEDVQDMARILGGARDLKTRARVMKDETHMSVYGAALSQGLRWLHEVAPPAG